MHEGLFRRRRLPHWDIEDGTYFVTTCLAGSIPAQGLLDLYRYRDELAARAKPKGLDENEWEIRRHKLVFARFDELIDRGAAVKHLENPAAADIVRDALYHFAGDRYDLIAFVVMPSHFHWVFHPRAAWVESLRKERPVGQAFLPAESAADRNVCQVGQAFLPAGSAPAGNEADRNVCPTRKRDQTPRERIMLSIKGYTAYRCNRLLGLSGPFWQDEAYDHVVRDDDELLRILEYVEQNPVKAGLACHPEEWLWSSAHDRLGRRIMPGEFLLR